MTYDDQVKLPCVRGMHIENQDRAKDILAWLNYYRLSGYSYPMRRFDCGTRRRFDSFIAGSSFDLVVELYKFDERLRYDVFMKLDRVEMAIRTMLGYELGRVHPLVYLDTKSLGARAEQRRRKDDRRVHDV